MITAPRFQPDTLSVSSTERWLNRRQSSANGFCKGSDSNILGFADQGAELRIFVLNLYLGIYSSFTVCSLGCARP